MEVNSNSGSCAGGKDSYPNWALGVLLCLFGSSMSSLGLVPSVAKINENMKIEMKNENEK